MEFETARRKMVESQIRPNDVTDMDVVHAFATVPREAFVPKSKKALAYSELEIETTHGRALWLARDQSKVLQALELKKSDLVLVIGASEGYSAALLDSLVDTVIALENDETVVEETSERLAGLGYNRVACVTGPLEQGYAAEGPYDAILVNGRVETMPESWLDQLKPGGRMAVVVGTQDAAQVQVYTASEHAVSHRKVFECVPPALSEFDAEPAFEF